MPQYGDPDYWDKRYSQQKHKTFDWLENWASLKEKIEPLISKDSRILILGCGNALFSEEMYDAGYENIDNIDISSVVIDVMKERNIERSKMTWETMDVMNMSYSDNSYDIAIDKSTIDALLCGSHAFVNVAKMTREVQRVLKPGGYYFVISYGKPENRNCHFERDHLDFTFEIDTVYPLDCKTEIEKKNKQHYIYICKKGENSEEADENWTYVLNKLIQKEENSDDEKQSKLTGIIEQD